MRLLVEESLAIIPHSPPVQITTPTGAAFDGFLFQPGLCGVSIVRAGESMEQALRDVIKGVRIGKILIQRNEESADKEAKLYYSKLPGDVASREVMLLDPMLASGGSAICAVKVLLDAGVPEEKITFVNLVSCPEGLANLTRAHPKMTIVTSFVDPVLNSNKWIIPGLGDFGDRYFGTEEDQHGPRHDSMGSAKLI
jgi:uracil phosphoribosyltransferase